MLNGSTIGGIRAIFAASCFLVTHASAQEYYDVMSGRMPTSTSSMMFSYGANPTTAFPPRAPAAIRPRVHVEAPVSYCVRTCDGRYFPTPSGSAQSKAQACKDLCPASETKVFSGSSIDNASSKDGRPYSALPHAFLYRKELVAGCTCNGKYPVLSLKREAMAANKPKGDNARKGAVKKRTQLKNPLTKTSTKRNKEDGQFMAVKKSAKKYKGVRKEK